MIIKSAQRLCSVVLTSSNGFKSGLEGGHSDDIMKSEVLAWHHSLRLWLCGLGPSLAECLLAPPEDTSLLTFQARLKNRILVVHSPDFDPRHNEKQGKLAPTGDGPCIPSLPQASENTERFLHAPEYLRWWLNIRYRFGPSNVPA